MDFDHYRRLERMYASAPITQWFGTSIQIEDGRAEVRLTLRPEFHHAANAVHGAVYFRLLDDASFFAVSSRVTEVFVLTVSFTVHFFRPVADGELRAVGRVMHGGGRLFVAESQLLDQEDRLIGHGTGVFSRSTVRLDPSIGYA